MKSVVRMTVGSALGLLALAGCGGGDGGGGDCDPIAATLVSRIEVDPATVSVADGESAQLTARAFSCDGTQLTTPFTWQSSDATTVSVSPSGLVSGVRLGGPVAVKAAAQGKEGSAAISVVPRAVASVRIEPATANVAVGRTSTLVAVALDAQGNTLPGRTATWTSADETIVTVSRQGAITGVLAGGPVTITATIEGHSGTAQVTVVEAAVATVTVSPSTTDVPAGSTVQLTAVLRDDQGNILTGRAVLWTTTDAVRTSVSTTGLVTGLALGGPVTILATSEGRTGESAVTVVPGSASQLAFAAPLSNVVAGAAIPDVRVEVRDAAGNRVPTSTAPVTMSLGANPGGAVLSGTRTVNAVAGVASFTNLRINRAGEGYALRAESPGLTDAVSSSFNVTPGAPASIRFSVQPSNVTAGDGIAPAIQVELVDAQGNLATASTAAVSLSLGTNPGGATLSGEATVNAVAGVATFSGLSLNQAGTGYTLVAASAGLPVVASAAFDVIPGAPATLTFVTQPTNTVAGDAISPAVQVEVRDALGNLVTNASTQVTLALGNNPGGATLGGTTTVGTDAGIATFAVLTLDAVGVGYTLVASSGALNRESSAFDVTPGPAASLRFLVGPPTSASLGEILAPPIQVEVLDAFGNRVVTSSATVVVSKTGAGSQGRLQGTKTRAAEAGVATFDDLRFTATGTYALVASSAPLTADSSGAIAIGF